MEVGSMVALDEAAAAAGEGLLLSDFKTVACCLPEWMDE
jgi:hypothetical protein